MELQIDWLFTNETFVSLTLEQIVSQVTNLLRVK